jgi:hypothetical protein
MKGPCDKKINYVKVRRKIKNVKAKKINRKPKTCLIA